MKNTGVKKPIIKETDWKVGAESGIKYVQICDDWTPYLPVYETQQTSLIATQACVTFSAYNCIETQLKQQTGIERNFSDRFTAKMSGTTAIGNTLQNVIDSIRNDGWLYEEDYPFVENYGIYYQEIPQELKDKAKQNLANADWQISYEWVNINYCLPNLDILKTQLKQAPLQRVTSFNSGVCSAEHATMLYKIDDNYIYYYDSYNGGIRQVPLDYPMAFIMKIVVTAKAEQPALIPPVTKDLYYGTMNNIEVKYLQQKLIKLGFLSKGLDTGNYLNLTKLAVSKFQWSYKVANPAILLWNGGKLVASATRNKLNSL